MSKMTKLIYEGTFERGKLNGYGIVWKNLKKYLEGNWKNGVLHGVATEYYQDGTIKYNGHYLNNKRNGYGVSYHPNGNYEYDGMWQNDNYHGYGILYLENGLLFYDGDFKNNLFHNEGTIYYGITLKIYNGQFKFGKYHGYGTSYYNSNIVEYEGFWNHDKKHGYGTLYQYHDKEKFIDYEGNWQNDKRHGYGKEYFQLSKQLKFSGLWKEDEKHGRGVLFDKNGKKLEEGMWRNEKSPTFVKKIKQEREQMRIRQFMETRDETLLKYITLPSFRLYFSQNGILSKVKTRQESINFIKKIPHCKKNIVQEDEEYDFFGHKIENPVVGSDEAIYDKKSVEYYLKKDKDGDFVNISYIYNEKQERVPYFPPIQNNKPLTHFYELSSLPKNSPLYEKLSKFIN